MKTNYSICPNGLQIAEGGALYHKCLIEITNARLDAVS